MDNETLNHTQETLSDDVGAAAQKTVDETEVQSQTQQPAAAFDYQPPEITVPEQPSSNDMTVKAEQPVPESASACQPPYQQPYQPPYQQAYQQPVQQAYQPPYQLPVQQPAQQPSGIPPITQQYYQYTPVNPALVSRQSTADGFAVASLICALVGLFSCCTVLPSFLAIIFGAISKAKNDGTRPTGMSTAGLVLGIIGVLLNLFILMIMFMAD